MKTRVFNTAFAQAEIADTVLEISSDQVDDVRLETLLKTFDEVGFIDSAAKAGPDRTIKRALRDIPNETRWSYFTLTMISKVMSNRSAFRSVSIVS